MNLIVLPANTYLLMLLVYIFSSLQVVVLALAISKARREISDLRVQLLQTLRTVGPLPSLIASTFEEVKKGNKDQQEIKTKLTNLKQNVQIVKEKAFPMHVIGKAATTSKAGKAIKIIIGKKAKISKRG